MASLITNQEQFFSDICDEIRLFFPVKKIENAREIQSDVFCVRADLDEVDDIWIVNVSVHVNGERVLAHTDKTEILSREKLEYKKLKKRFLKNSVYALLKAYTGKTLPWGSLTGIRPVKLAREMEKEAIDPYAQLSSNFDVSENKAALVRKINNVQRPYIGNVGEKDIDVYIGIPFCKTRCCYCSFISREYNRNAPLKDKFLKKLFIELEHAEKIVEHYDVRCVYVGGGTPTSLSADEFERLLTEVDRAFASRREYTVEAGRPDTLDERKLEIMKCHNVGRISINPQTTCGSTLKLIGRDYPSELYYKVFALARKYGFDNINSDVIMGLPGEDADTMYHTIDDVAALRPENITVHTLAVKNSSYLADNNELSFPDSSEVSDAVEYASSRFCGLGYAPYYMYRQKYMSGNLENTGYSLPGKICMYNIDNMEETVSVLALGAGGISKRIFANENRIERACNVKDIRSYCERTEEMAMRKSRLFGIDTF